MRVIITPRSLKIHLSLLVKRSRILGGWRVSKWRRLTDRPPTSKLRKVTGNHFNVIPHFLLHQAGLGCVWIHSDLNLVFRISFWFFVWIYGSESQRCDSSCGSRQTGAFCWRRVWRNHGKSDSPDHIRPSDPGISWRTQQETTSELLRDTMTSHPTLAFG